MITETKTAVPQKAPRTRRIGIIFRKEFWEIFRERRTLMSVVISPLLITPALFALMGVLITGQAQKARTRAYAVGMVAAPAALLGRLGDANLRPVPVSRADAEARIRAHRLTAAAVLPPDLSARLGDGRAVPVQILSDAGDATSQAAAGRLRDAFEGIGRRVTAKRLRERGLPPEFATPFRVTDTPIKSGGSAAMLLLSTLLPYMLIISAFSGTIYAAFDQVAGEKERGTLETLLVSPASRRDIVLGKFGAVVAVCLISSLLTIAGLVLVFGSGLHTFTWLAKGGAHLSAEAVGVILLTLLPLSVLFAGLLLAVSTYARNQKEAQTVLGPLFTLVIIPGVMSTVITGDVSKALALAPILNAALIIKQALAGNFDWAFIALAFVASVAYAALALTFATRLFQKESVLIKA